MDSNGHVYSNVKDSFTTEHGGMKPIDLTSHHYACAQTVLGDAIHKAGIRLSAIDCIAYSQSPGMGNALRIGAALARTLSATLQKPLVGVNHCIAHLEIGLQQTGAQDPVFLYASGANTQIIAYEGNRYRIFGETLDVGIGNFLDSFARKLDLGFPGGPKIERLACQASHYSELPYTVKGMDVSFGGLLTHLENMIQKQETSKENLCYSTQETAFAMLLEVSERAMAHTGKSELLLGGGVACNKRLQEMAQTMAKEREATCFIPKNEFLVDNAAMIAWLGILKYQHNMTTSLTDAIIYPYRRTDDIDVAWR
jgi:glycoprotease/Kae1 family metallohydrolase